MENDNVCFCPKCGAKNPAGSDICNSCGRLMNDEKTESDDDIVRCPKCGSTQVEFVTKSYTQGASLGNACCGMAIFGPLGALCGLSGAGKGRSRAVRKCKKCGKEF